MPAITHDVELIMQGVNPIFWIASCAMAKGYVLRKSVGIGEFTEGLDPSTSCISNLGSSWSDCTDLMQSWGFQLYTVSGMSGGDMTSDALFTALGEGPIVLLHQCTGFPYGPQYAGNVYKPDDAHAVVLTAVDTDAGSAAFNNPWGDKDQSCNLADLIAKINADQACGKTLAYYSG
jgi:hypothetical protein